MWSEKHRPKSINSMIGNEESRAEIVKWFAEWKKGAKPLLLVGPPGIGKTTMAFIIADQFRYDMIGLNASDVRNKAKIKEILSPILESSTVMGTPMIFIDEVDGIHGRSDYGGVAALVDILKEPTVPMILAANDDTSDKMKPILKVVKTIKFKKIPPRLLRIYLQNILKREGEQLSPGSLIKVINKARGDIRSMINLAQSLVTGFNPQTDTSFEHISVEEGVNAFFKSKTLEEARGILYAMQVDPREKIQGFYSSIITSDIDVQRLAYHMQVLSDADMLYGKIVKTQNWRLLRYLNDILLRLHGDTSIRYTKYNLPFPILNQIRWDGAKIRAMSIFFAKKLHMSSSAFVTLCMPFMLYCIKNDTLELDDHTEIIAKEVEKIRVG